MRDTTGGDAAEQWSDAAEPEEKRSQADKTTVVSVATLRRLAERSAEDPADPPTEVSDSAESPSSPPAFFAKSGAVLVLSKPGSTPRDSHPGASGEQAGSDPVREAEAEPADLLTRSEVRQKALAFPAAAPGGPAPSRPNPAEASSSFGRKLTLAIATILALAVVAKAWESNLGGVRERAAACAPAVRALVDWGRALLPK